MNCEFADEDNGYIRKSDLLSALHELNFSFPRNFLQSVIEDIQLDPSDKSSLALLSYQKLSTLIDLYSQCPVVARKDANESDNFKRAIDGNMSIEEIKAQGRAEKLIKFVHQRIEEKFRGFRYAYRTFDKNYDGDLSFPEFMTGLENIGIKLKYSDYKLIFDTLDYDQEGEIDYNKFLLLNTDNKRSERISYIEKKKGEREVNRSEYDLSTKKSVEHKGFGDGVIPKNKSIASFHHDIQEKTDLQKFLDRRWKISVPSESSFTYGTGSTPTSGMKQLLSNKYQKEYIAKKKFILKEKKKQQKQKMKEIIWRRMP